MRLRVQVRVARRLLWVSGLSLLGYCGYVSADAWLFQREAEATFATAIATVAAPPRPVAAEEVLGRLVIERLGVSVMVLEGTSAKTLRRAAGHIAGTAMPGETGNVGISGHRDTFFLPLQNVRRGDTVALSTRAGQFRYRVVSLTVVQPDDTAVLAGGEGEVLTLVTCYPFTFIGAAPERFIVRAERVI